MRKLKTLYNQQTAAATYPSPPGNSIYSSAVSDYAGYSGCRRESRHRSNSSAVPDRVDMDANHHSATFLLHPGFMDEDNPAEPVQINVISLNEMVLLTIEQAVNRYNIGKASIREAANEAGAVVRIGRRILFHRETLDNYFDGLRE